MAAANHSATTIHIPTPAASHPTSHRTATVDGLEIFYRELGRRMPQRCCCCTAFPPRRINTVR